MWEQVASADVVVHAGDWVEPALLDALEARAKRLVACWGNNDGDELRRRLPERADVDARRAAVHRRARDGRVGGRDERMAQELSRYRRAGVRAQPHPVGHHRETGLRLLNPGSPTDRRRQPDCTYMTATVGDGALTDVKLHRVDRDA